MMTLKRKLPETTAAFLIGCALVLAAAAAFWPVGRHEFLNYDDPDYVTDNPMVQSGVTLKAVAWALITDHAGNWHPLTWWSHMLDWSLYGDWAGGHHLTSVVLHLANSLLLFALLWRMAGSLWRSAMVAGLFALHPLHVESVAWVAERKDVLSGFFFMLTLWAYAEYARRAESRKQKAEIEPELRERHGGTKGSQPTTSAGVSRFTLHAASYYWFALFFFALGLMSKPMLVTVPCVLLLLDYWPLGRWQASALASRPFGWLPLLREKVPFFLLSAISCFITFVVQRRGGAMAEMQTLSFEFRVQNSIVAYASYLRKMLWPSDLAVFYPLPADYAAGTLLLALGLLGVVTAAAIKWRSEAPYVAMGWFWFLGMLVPVIGLVQVGVQSMADRYTYLPLIGIFIAGIWGASDLLPRYRLASVAPVAGAVLLGVCGYLSARQVSTWRNNVTVFSHAIAVTEGNFISHHNLGVELGQRGEVAAAAHHFEQAVRFRPYYAEAESDWGLALVLQEKVDEGIEHYRKAIAIRPSLDKPHYNLGRALAKQGKTDQAIAEYQEALRLNPDYAEAREALALALAEKGQKDEAASRLNELVRSKPLDPDLRVELAGVLLQQGKRGEALREMEEVVRLRPKDAGARERLGVVLAQAGRVEDAIVQFTEAVRLQPSAQLHYHLGLAWAILRDYPKAVASYRQALEARPDWTEALNDLAWILSTAPDAQVRDGVEAVKLAEKACNLDRSQPRYFGTLDAAYAESGRFEEAIRTATRVREMSLAAGLADLASAAEKRVELYRLGKAYRQ